MPPRSRRKQRAPRCMWAVAEVTRRRRQTVWESSSMTPMLHLHRMPRRIRHELLAKSNFEAGTPPVVPPQPPVAIVLLRWSNHGANLSRSWDPRMDGSWVWISSVMPHGHAYPCMGPQLELPGSSIQNLEMDYSYTCRFSGWNPSAGGPWKLCIPEIKLQYYTSLRSLGPRPRDGWHVATVTTSV